MATQWGRKETIIWPPHVPVLSYAAVAMALLCTCALIWQRLTFSVTPLQKSYITEYIRSEIGSTFNTHESYRLLYLGGGKGKPRLAFPVDFVAGKTALPNGKVVPVALSDLATAQGYRWFFRGPEQKLADRTLHRWLRLTVYEDKSLFAVFAISFIEGGVCLTAMLWFAVPYDIRRFKQMKYGRILRGPQLLSPQEFNQQQKGDGIGFKTTELGKMMRIPARKEAQHFQIMGDTGVGKTQLIMQILRQIRERGDSAIIYDPASEYLQRFYDKERGDIILNPLDARCPYWGPAQEMASNAEADAIAASLYQPTTDVKDEFFHQTPAQIFAHLLRKGPTPHQLAEWMANSETLETLVAGTEMSFYIDRKAAPSVPACWHRSDWWQNVSASCRKRIRPTGHGTHDRGLRNARDGSSLRRVHPSAKRSVPCIHYGLTCLSCACSPRRSQDKSRYGLSSTNSPVCRSSPNSIRQSRRTGRARTRSYSASRARRSLRSSMGTWPRSCCRSQRPKSS